MSLFYLIIPNYSLTSVKGRGFWDVVAFLGGDQHVLDSEKLQCSCRLSSEISSSWFCLFKPAWQSVPVTWWIFNSWPQRLLKKYFYFIFLNNFIFIDGKYSCDAFPEVFLHLPRSQASLLWRFFFCLKRHTSLWSIIGHSHNCPSLLWKTFMKDIREAAGKLISFVCQL